MSEHIRARSLTLVDSNDVPVVNIGLSENNEKPQREGRLKFKFAGSYPSEVEIEPGPDVVARGNIVSQVMQWGPRTPDGTGRNRITLSITADNAGGLSCVLDSSTNDPSGSAGQERAMPLVLNVGEAKGIYIVLFADGRVKFRHGDQERLTTVAAIVAGA